MATEIVDIIDPNDSGAPYTADYSSLSAWEAGEQRDLTSSDEIAVADCRSFNGDADTVAVSISGWTTDSTRFIKIWTDPAQGYRHDGKWDSSAYRLVVTDAECITSYEDHVRAIGLQLFRTYVASQYGGTAFFRIELSNSQVLIGECLLTADGSNQGINIANNATDGAAYLKIYNSIVFGVPRNGITSSAGSGVIEAYNTNVIKCGTTNSSYHGFSGLDICKNCIAAGTAGNDFNSVATVDYCASDDGTGTNSQTLDGSNNYQNEFVDYVNNDFHLVSGSACINSGVTNPGSGLYLDDIDGDTRSAWDIGADEYASAGTTLPPITMHHLTKNLG